MAQAPVARLEKKDGWKPGMEHTSLPPTEESNHTPSIYHWLVNAKSLDHTALYP